ncbi:MAG: Pup--protein ligase [Corynebacterium sp.]|nr:Pup--protein ligase [Corynebacterium sp.]
MGVETEYGLSAQAFPERRQITPDEAARELFRPVIQEYNSSNVFTPNGSRLYLDVGTHPEIATAECDSLSQLLAYERAGDAIINELAIRAEEALRETRQAQALFLFKNNVDSQGNTYGCHENYLISRHVVLKDISRALMPFMITRQLMCGAGMVKPANGDEPARFVLSQRADKVWEGVSSATTRSRPIINTRDEPHGDSKRFRRMHVIVGDSNMAEPTFALKIGSTQLVLEMIEAKFPLPELEIADPIAFIRGISEDITGSTEIALANGTTVTALEIQEQLCARAADWLKHREDVGTPTAELERVVQLWQRTLHAIKSKNLSLISNDIDWVIKLQLLEKFKERLNCDWSHPKLAQVDLTYHDIRPGRGLYDVLLQRGLIAQWIEDPADVTVAKNTPPQTTRAKLRGEFLAQSKRLGAETTVDWMRFKINRPEPKSVDFDDPFDAHDERLQELLDYMEAHHQ